MLMSDLGIFLCSTDAELQKLINKTNIAALGLVLMEGYTSFVSANEVGLQQRGAALNEMQIQYLAKLNCGAGYGRWQEVCSANNKWSIKSQKETI